MGKALMVVLISLFVCGVARADWLDDLEFLKAELKPCALYSVKENQLGYASSLQLIGYKGFEIDGIHSPDRNMLAIGLGYEITSLDKWVDVPLAKIFVLTIGGYYGVRDFTTEDRGTDYGAYATLIKGSF